MILLMTSVWAFDSVCRTTEDATEKCDEGYEAARNRWSHDDSEHMHIFEYALELSGAPEDWNETFTLTTYGDGTSYDSIHSEEPKTFTSVRPVAIDPVEEVTRTRKPSEFTQLPDFSYGLYDWVAGNETCLAFTTDHETCHLFETHTGSLNSSHFVPQSQRFYGHYHQLAIERARACKETHDALDDAGALDRFEDTVLACEKEALVLEAIAHHYLQDAWSMGHMWERWGGPDLSDWSLGLPSAQVVGPLSGTVHGAKAVLGEGFDDPLCAPHPNVSYIDGGDQSESLGAGDYFLDSFMWSDPDYDAQLTAMVGCSVQSLREVYSETAMLHAPLEDAWSGVDLSRSPSGDSCWGQRATNLAMAEGWGISVGWAPNSIHVISGPVAIIVNSLLGYIPANHAALDFDLSVGQMAQLNADVAYNTVLVQMWAELAPDGTQMASGRMDPVLEAQPNSTYARGGQGNTDDPPSGYVDVSLPWHEDGSDMRARMVNLGFADSHAPDRCATFTQEDLNAYVETATGAQGTESFGAACGQCVQMISPHLRVGTGPTDYDTEREPLCSYVEEAPAYIYTDEWEVDTTTRGAANQVCGCGDRVVVITRGGTNDQLEFWRAMGTDIEIDGPALDLPSSPRDAVLGGEIGRELLVVGGEHVAFFDTLPGGEFEIDVDDDPTTTTDGAMSGTSRLEVGSGPRGIALQPDGRYGLVTTKDNLVVIDHWARTVEASFPKTDLGFHSSETPYDVVITSDGSTAFVAAFGTFSNPSNEVHVLNLSGLPDELTLETTISTGGETNNQFLALSPDGSRLAVTCPNTDQAKVYETTSPYNHVGSYQEYYFEQSDYPIAVDWSPEGDALYVGYLSGPYDGALSGYGVVRKCKIDEPDNCEHAVGVTGAVRDLAVTPGGMVWVADDLGNLTGLGGTLFEPGQTTSGKNQQTGLYDGTGGCIDEDLRAHPCPAQANVGQTVGTLMVF